MIELLKVEFRVVGLLRDEDGSVREEVTVAQGAAYAAGLDNLADEVRKIVAGAAEQE